MTMVVEGEEEEAVGEEKEEEGVLLTEGKKDGCPSILQWGRG